MAESVEPQLVKSVSVCSEAESVASFLSDDLEDVDEADMKTYDVAPEDIMHEYEGKKIRVLKKGEKVPCNTKYKVVGTTGISFRVSDQLGVTILKKIDCSKKVIKTPESYKFSPSSSSRISIKEEDDSFSPTGRGVLPVRKRRLEQEDAGGEAPAMKKVKEEVVEPKHGNKFRSQAEWICFVEKNFMEIICGGLDVSLREQTKKNVLSKVKLTPRQNAGVINSLNYAVKEQYGLQTPNQDLCRRLAQLLRSKIPDTYSVVEAVRTEYGDLPMSKQKGEGGVCKLEKRIAVNFYNKFMRSSRTVMKPSKASPLDTDLDVRNQNSCFESSSVTVNNQVFKKPVKKLMIKPVKKLMIKPVKKLVIKPVIKPVINRELSPFELIREANIAEQRALLEKLGFSVKKKVLKTKVKVVKITKSASPAVVRKSSRLNKGV